MRKIEKLYRVATQYKLNFNYHHGADGTQSATIVDPDSDLVLDYTVLESEYTWIMVAGKHYHNFDSALQDFLDLLALKKG